MSSPKTQILLYGATGYVGGSVLEQLLNHPDFPSFNITALVRSPEKAEKLKGFGITSAVGSLDDLGLVEQLASQAEFVISAADADNLPSIQATLKGMKRRFEATGKPPILIHTSGTGVLGDNAQGMHDTDIVYDDANPDQIETLPSTQIHREVDLTIVDADKAGYIKSHIILPSTIYGIARGKLFDSGIANRHSVQIPFLIAVSLAGGQGRMVGLGKNLWPNVEVHENANLYIVLFDALRANKDIGHGREGYYFVASGEHRLYDLCKAIAEALVEEGRGKSPEPLPFMEEELRADPRLAAAVGTNSRCIANRSRSIGWAPKKTTKDLLASIRPEVEALISK